MHGDLPVCVATPIILSIMQRPTSWNVTCPGHVTASARDHRMPLAQRMSVAHRHDHRGPTTARYWLLSTCLWSRWRVHIIRCMSSNNYLPTQLQCRLTVAVLLPLQSVYVRKAVECQPQPACRLYVRTRSICRLYSHVRMSTLLTPV